MRGAVLPADHYNIKRLIFVQNKVIAPLVSESCRLLYEAETAYQVRLDADANNREVPNEMRQISLQKEPSARARGATRGAGGEEAGEVTTPSLALETRAPCSSPSPVGRVPGVARLGEEVVHDLLDLVVICRR